MESTTFCRVYNAKTHQELEGAPSAWLVEASVYDVHNEYGVCNAYFDGKYWRLAPDGQEVYCLPI